MFSPNLICCATSQGTQYFFYLATLDRLEIRPPHERSSARQTGISPEEKWLNRLQLEAYISQIEFGFY